MLGSYSHIFSISIHTEFIHFQWDIHKTISISNRRKESKSIIYRRQESKWEFTWLIAINVWQTGQGTNSSFTVGFSSRLSSKETISTILAADSFLIGDVVGISDWIFDPVARDDVDHGVFVEDPPTPPPSKRPCPLKGVNDVTGRDTTPPWVGLALFDGGDVSVDAIDGDLTVMVELPLFFVAPTNPATVLPFADGFDELKYPEMDFPLATLWIRSVPLVPGPLTGLLNAGRVLFKGDDGVLLVTVALEEPAMGLERKPRMSRAPDVISTFCFFEPLIGEKDGMNTYVCMSRIAGFNHTWSRFILTVAFLLFDAIVFRFFDFDIRSITGCFVASPPHIIGSRSSVHRSLD